MAIMSEISGVVSQDDTKKNVVIKVTGKDETGAEVVKSYSIPFTQHSRVMPGDRVEKGYIITREGVLYPQDILAIKGLEDVQNYLINEVQKVYRCLLYTSCCSSTRAATTCLVSAAIR